MMRAASFNAGIWTTSFTRDLGRLRTLSLGIDPDINKDFAHKLSSIFGKASRTAGRITRAVQEKRGGFVAVRVLLDVAHPAHVQVMRPVALELQKRGAEVLFAGRAKDMTAPLLEASGLPTIVASRAAQRRSRTKDAWELAVRIRSIRRIVREWRPEVLLTRNPSGVLAALRTPTWTVFDTDDGSAAGLHYRLAAPSADVVTSSVHDPEDHGHRHLRYPGLKPHAFLHPDGFRPDLSARGEVGLSPTEPLHVVRWSRHDASHDADIVGMTSEGRTNVVALLRGHGAVLESVEGSPPRLLTDRGVRPVAPSRFLDLLATASCCVTDGQSLASEAAVLGVPVLRLSGFTGRVWYLALLERRGLVRNFSPGGEQQLLDALAGVLTAPVEAREQARHAARRLNEGAEDLALWFATLAGHLAATPKPRGRRDAMHALSAARIDPSGRSAAPLTVGGWQ